jgi:ATP-binding cassette, subfamily B, bacterial MsbA
VHVGSANDSIHRWFLASVRQFPWHSAGVVILSVLNSFADGLSISLLIPFLTMLFARNGAGPTANGTLGKLLLSLTEYAGPGRELSTVSCAIVALVALKAGFAYGQQRLSYWISGRISCDLRSRIHENLLKVDYQYISLNDNARLLNTLDGEAWRATEAISTFFGLFTSLCMAVVLSGILLLISWQLTLLVALLVGSVSALMLLFDRRLRAISAKSVELADDLYERAMEVFNAMRMTRAYGQEARAQLAYDEASARLFEISMRRVRSTCAGHATQEVLYAINFVVVIFASLRLELGGAVLIAYLALLHRLQPHVRAIDAARMQLAASSGSVRAVSRLLCLPHWSASAPTAPAPPRLEGAIRFERVSFAYLGKDQEPRTALDEVTFELPVGEMTAIVGWSGAGKSTILNLLFRFYDPASGSITLNGTPIDRFDLGWWRAQLAIAGQDADLIGGTIRDNIAYGRHSAVFEDVVAAAKLANVHDFVLSLPLGYETRVGSRGVLLSGGQRQRIGLARALLRRSGILLLDEATNSLDSMTESEILRALEVLRGQLTIVVIAHRLSTTRTADRVIALSGGRVVESGSPADLLRADGLYRQMVQLQELIQQRDEPRGAIESTVELAL